MMTPPERPKIYHITHLDNLASIVAARCIESDGSRNRSGLNHSTIGMPEIKRRRLYELEVTCHPGTKVGDYMPFYFCCRSIMLYILHKGNHADLSYHGGQESILHLQADLEAAISWADQQRVPWAFTDRNAGTRFTDFFKNRAQLDHVDWGAVRATDFRDSMVKEGKQAEFLVYESFPWPLVEKIGVIDTDMLIKTDKIFQQADHKPVVQVERTWYF